AVLARMLASDDEPLRRHAREALGALGAAALDPLRGALAAEALRVRWGALYALARIGRPAEPLAGLVAQRAREGEHEAERRQARFTLARLGGAGAEACAAFLGSEEAAERDEAAAALAFSGADGVPPLLRLIQGEDEVGAAVAAGVLEDIARRGPLGPQAAQAAAVLVGALDREGPVRFNAMDALTAMGAEARSAVEELSRTGSADLQQVAAVILEGIAEVEGAR
ncbi:MAG: hypothetical protein P1V36_14045, partial [Planctomycetota bacterium]|nr:hypothetical protein [Planctomycetota bacterium]